MTMITMVLFEFALWIRKFLTQELNFQIVNMNLFLIGKLLYVAVAKQCHLLPIVTLQY